MYVECIEQMRYAYDILVKKPKDSLGDIGVDERTVLKWILNK
jgi:hypothetical protein